MEPQLSSYLITDEVDLKSTVCLWTSGVPHVHPSWAGDVAQQ